MLKKFIAFEGEKFTLEWYFDERGKSNAFEYFNELDIAGKKKALNLFKLIGNRGKVFNKEKFNYEEDQIFAIKPTPDRFLCFFHKDKKIIITNAFQKKTQKLHPREKERALRAKEDYLKRYEKGNYYE